MVFFKKAQENEIDKFYASAYIAYQDDNLLLDEFDEDEDIKDSNDEEEDIVQLALTQFDDELFTLNEDSLFMDEWFDDQDGSEWIVSNEAVSSFYDYQWENDEIWDEIDHEILTTNGNSIDRKCMHMWGQRLCLCQFLDWLDSHKYKCLQNTRNYLPMTQISGTTHKTMSKELSDKLHEQEYKYYDDKLLQQKRMKEKMAKKV